MNYVAFSFHLLWALENPTSGAPALAEFSRQRDRETPDLRKPAQRATPVPGAGEAFPHHGGMAFPKGRKAGASPPDAKAGPKARQWAAALPRALPRDGRGGVFPGRIAALAGPFPALPEAEVLDKLSGWWQRTFVDCRHFTHNGTPPLRCSHTYRRQL